MAEFDSFQISLAATRRRFNTPPFTDEQIAADPGLKDAAEWIEKYRVQFRIILEHLARLHHEIGALFPR
jgi:hypothetical protein